MVGAITDSSGSERERPLASMGDEADDSAEEWLRELVSRRAPQAAAAVGLAESEEAAGVWLRELVSQAGAGGRQQDGRSPPPARLVVSVAQRGET